MIKLDLESDVVLGDQEIREALIARLSKAPKLPKAIIEEVRVHNGNAIADVVTIYNYAHCYEIKSDRDSIERAVKQAAYYDLAFRKVTLVTTKRHLHKAVELIPAHWGIILTRQSINSPAILTYVRPAKFSPHFNKELALLTLWKSELAEIASPLPKANVAKLNRASLCSLIAGSFDVNNLSKFICSQLATRSFRLRSL